MIKLRLTEEEYLALTGQTPEKKKRKSKYHNKKMYVCKNGAVFEDKETAEIFGIKEVYDSKKEFNRYCELQYLERAGLIQNLSRQVKWIISPKAVYNGEVVREIAYKADFQYTRDGKTVVEDVKPFDIKTMKYKTTKDFNIKWKLLKEKYPDVLFELF